MASLDTSVGETQRGEVGRQVKEVRDRVAAESCSQTLTRTCHLPSLGLSATLSFSVTKGTPGDVATALLFSVWAPEPHH